MLRDVKLTICQEAFRTQEQKEKLILIRLYNECIRNTQGQHLEMSF